MTIDKSKLISAIETHLRDEYVGKSATCFPKNYTITDVGCEIGDEEKYFEDGGIFLRHNIRISYRDFKVKFLIRCPEGRLIQWIDADISF